LPDFTPEAVEKQTGVSAGVIKRLAHELTHSGSAAAMIGGAPLAHTNGLFNALAVNALESLVDQGQILGFTPALQPAAPAQASLASLSAFAQSALSGQPHAPQMLLLYEANHVFSAPPVVRIREALAKIPTIVSFGSFIDETSAQADLILPDHAPLESWLDSTPESGSMQTVVNLSPPAVLPLHDTRSMPDVLLGVAHQLGGEVAKALPAASYDAMMRAAYVPLRTRAGSVDVKTDDDFWDAAQTQGGWWSTPSPAHNPQVAVGKRAPASMAAPEFAGSPSDFPFYFLPYVSQSFGDG
jgi:anaerobic selenocysteine-containing dehydrogenase